MTDGEIMSPMGWKGKLNGCTVELFRNSDQWHSIFTPPLKDHTKFNALCDSVEDGEGTGAAMV